MNTALVQFMTDTRESAAELALELEPDSQFPPAVFFETDDINSDDGKYKRGGMGVGEVFSGDPRKRIVFLQHILPSLIQSEHVKRVIVAMEVGFTDIPVADVEKKLKGAKPDSLEECKPVMDTIRTERTLVLIACDAENAMIFFNKINAVETFPPRLTSWDALDTSEKTNFESQEWVASHSVFEVLTRHIADGLMNAINGKKQDGVMVIGNTPKDDGFNMGNLPTDTFRYN